MEEIRAYILSVTAAAVLCGIVMALAGTKGTTAAIVKLLSGIVLAIAVLRPLGFLQLEDLGRHINRIGQDAADAVAYGTELTEEALSQRIKQQSESYILDKAAELGAAVAVTVELSGGELPQPVRVTIEGNASPYAKGVLRQIITQELGIPEEAQVWI